MASDQEVTNWAVEDGVFLRSAFFQIRFGSENGVQKAYFTETIPATICDIRLTNTNLSVFATDTTVPQN